MTNQCVTKGFHHAAMKVADYDAVVAFYRDGLGFTEKISWGEGDGRAIMLDAGNGNYLEVFAGGQPASGDGHVMHLAFRVANCDEALARAVAAGARVTMEPKDVTIPSRPEPTPVRIAFCAGLAGEIMEFFQNDRT